MATTAAPATIYPVTFRRDPAPRIPKQSPQSLLHNSISSASSTTTITTAFPLLRLRRRGTHNADRILASVSSSSAKPKESEQMRPSPVDLVDSILSKAMFDLVGLTMRCDLSLGATLPHATCGKDRERGWIDSRVDVRMSPVGSSVP
ncbi:hypothetical protein RHMOL_Rhmol07G0217100 [Rhododendron molle]|uniref:Uncharacterized protein n=1 Tax=Rhododendron molle TaxID=49168 RepID=A0ACC0N3G0_RHOML|nr:hypothetical protein RHMOL_Rhmol07G0217100 [Rhododendron molle]